jgi:hypothetical protein
MNDIWINILQFLDTKSILRFSRVCKNFYRISKSEIVWKHIYDRECFIPYANIGDIIKLRTTRHTTQYSRVKETFHVIRNGKRKFTKWMYNSGRYHESWKTFKARNIIEEILKMTHEDEILINREMLDTMYGIGDEKFIKAIYNRWRYAIQNGFTIMTHEQWDYFAQQRVYKAFSILLDFMKEKGINNV